MYLWSWYRLIFWGTCLLWDMNIEPFFVNIWWRKNVFRKEIHLSYLLYIYRNIIGYVGIVYLKKAVSRGVLSLFKNNMVLRNNHKCFNKQRNWGWTVEIYSWILFEGNMLLALEFALYRPTEVGSKQWWLHHSDRPLATDLWLC